MTKELETLLNEVSFAEGVDPPVKEERVYIPCIGCDRRLYEGLFSKGFNTCCWCRDLDAHGNPVKKYIPEEY